MKAGEQAQGLSHSHVPGPCARTGFSRRCAGRLRGLRSPGHRASGAPGHTPPRLDGAGRGSRGLWCAEDRNQRGVPSGEGSYAPATPAPRSTHRPGAQSGMGICTCSALTSRHAAGRAGQGALRVEPSQKDDGSGPHPLLSAPLCSCSSPRDTVPTRPWEPRDRPTLGLAVSASPPLLTLLHPILGKGWAPGRPLTPRSRGRPCPFRPRAF